MHFSKGKLRCPFCIFSIGRGEPKYTYVNMTEPREKQRERRLRVHTLECLRGQRRGFPGDSVVNNPPVTQEMWVWSLGQEDPLEEGMTTHSIFLPGESPWAEERGGLQSMGLQRIGHNGSDWALMYAHGQRKPQDMGEFCPSSLFLNS